MAARASLMGMPDELLEQIVKNLDGVEVADNTAREDILSSTLEPRIALFHLTLCCKRLNEIANSLLYSTLVQSKEITLQSFVSRLLDAPDDAKRVKRVVCQARDPQHSRREWEDSTARGLPTMPDHNLRQCIDIIENTVGRDNAADWVRSLIDGHWGALFALLLCLVPSLESIELVEYNSGCHNINFIEEVLANAAVLQAPGVEGGTSLSSLKSIKIRQLGWSYITRPNHIQPFLDLKSIEALSVEYFSAGSGDSWKDHQVYPLKHLRLQHSTIDHQQLVEFLQRFGSLATFEYDHVTEFLFPQKWEQAIAHLTSTLQCLKLSGNVFNSHNYVARELGSLENFGVLKSITMECVTLLGPKSIGFVRPRPFQPTLPEPKTLIEVLPKSLQELKLVDCECMISQVVELVARKEELFPGLRTVVVDYGLKGDEGFALGPLTADIRSKGVRLTICRAKAWWETADI